GGPGSPTSGGHVNGPDVIGVFGCSGSASASCGTHTLTSFGTSAAPPPCPVVQCYPHYYDATPSVAADSAGHIVVAYTFSTVAGGPKSLYVATSGDGLTWSALAWSTPRATATSRRSPPAQPPVTSGWPAKTTAPAHSAPGTPHPPTAGPAGPAT